MISRKSILVGMVLVTALLLLGVLGVTTTAGSHLAQTRAGQQQNTNFLDLTASNPAESPRHRTGGGVATSGNAELIKLAPLGVTLHKLDRRSYHFGEQVTYEVTLENITKNVLTIPWSPEANMLGMDGRLNPPGYIEASLSLVAEDEIAGPQFIDSQRIFGASGFPGSLKTLRPGEKVRIRASGSWQFADSSVARRVFAKSPYTVTVRANFRLEESPSTPRYKTAVSINSQTAVLRKAAADN